VSQKSRRVRGALTAFGVMFLYASACIAPGSALAQQINSSTPNSYTDLSAYLVNNPSATSQQTTTAPPALSTTVTQIGQANAATVGLSGAGNITNQYQNGSQNSSTLSVNGAQNTVTTTQIGNSNTTSIGVNGSGNTINNLQVGTGLSYQIQVVGTAPAPISVQQYGRR
jgi:hypothetical protein